MYKQPPSSSEKRSVFAIDRPLRGALVFNTFNFFKNTWFPPNISDFSEMLVFASIIPPPVRLWWDPRKIQDGWKYGKTTWKLRKLCEKLTGNYEWINKTMNGSMKEPVNESMTGLRINESMKQRMHQCMNQNERIDERIDESVKQWTDEWANEGTNAWTNDWINESMVSWRNLWMNQWANECINESVNYSTNDSVNESMKHWMHQRRNHWMH